MTIGQPSSALFTARTRHEISTSPSQVPEAQAATVPVPNAMLTSRHQLVDRDFAVAVAVADALWLRRRRCLPRNNPHQQRAENCPTGDAHNPASWH